PSSTMNGVNRYTISRERGRGSMCKRRSTSTATPTMRNTGAMMLYAISKNVDIALGVFHIAHAQDLQEVRLPANSERHAADDHHRVVLLDQLQRLRLINRHLDHLVDCLEFFDQDRRSEE